VGLSQKLSAMTWVQLHGAGQLGPSPHYFHRLLILGAIGPAPSEFQRLLVLRGAGPPSSAKPLFSPSRHLVSSFYFWLAPTKSLLGVAFFLPPLGDSVSSAANMQG
jgi:hypothetical protein